MKMTCTLLVAIFLLSAAANSQQSQSNIVVYSISRADSLFQAQQWKAARKEYEGALQIDSNKHKALQWNRLAFCCHNLGDYGSALEHYKTALNNKPSPAVLATVHGRMSRIYGLRNETAQSLEHLEKAVAAGYPNLDELDTAREFKAIRGTEKFKELVVKAGVNAFPCRAHAQTREFDFWVGEWTVYATGTNFQVGNSIIQKASGDCMILENWTAKGPVPHNGKSVNYVNPQTNKWEQLWIGSNGGGNHVGRFYNGVYKDSVLRFEFEANTPQGKQMGRFSFFNQGPDQVRQLSETSPDGGKTWRTNYDFTYKRKK
ncbi:MAG TPA: tetratricopeptide repeat protein [Chitinophagaceae bacterium]|nr:tetratricopeptide repeat protein [Chitinophagaceae bacterium]